MKVSKVPKDELVTSVLPVTKVLMGDTVSMD